MHHRKGNKKLGRRWAHRLSMLRNQVASLIEHEKIQTTLSKAKETKRVAEKLITLTREDNYLRRRMAFGILADKGLVTKLFTELGPKYKGRAGGYTRIFKFGTRYGDNAPMAILKLAE